MKHMALVLAAGLYGAPALADIEVRFIEGAPKDRFVISNQSTCATGPVVVTLDLSTSQSGLIFDVTGAGAGVEVFQPFELASEGSALASVPEVRDGDNVLTLDVTDLPAGAALGFTIDVDDTVSGRQITVSGAEFAGVSVQLTAAGQQSTAQFGSTPKLTMAGPDCLS